MIHLAIVVLVLPLVVSAKPEKFAVLEFTVKGLPKETQTTFSAAVAAEIGRRPGYSVISKADIDAMLGFDRQKQALGCDDVSCLAEIGGALGVDKLVSGQVTQLGEGQTLISLQLLNTKRATVESRVSTKWEGTSSELLRVLEMLAQDLVLLPAERQVGAVQVVAAPKGAEVYVDNELKAVAPTSVAKDISLGVHTLRISSSGYDDLKTVVALKNGEILKIDGKLRELPSPPVYTRWWFWTIIGSVVAGGVVTAVILTRPQDSGGTITLPNPFVGTGR